MKNIWIKNVFSKKIVIKKDLDRNRKYYRYISTDVYNFFLCKAPHPIASPKFIMYLKGKISLQSGDCEDKICLK